MVIFDQSVRDVHWNQADLTAPNAQKHTQKHTLILMIEHNVSVALYRFPSPAVVTNS